MAQLYAEAAAPTLSAGAPYSRDLIAIPPLLGNSPAIELVRQTIVRLADTDLTVLLQGESGTGKEVVARQLWALSQRSTAPFVRINGAAIPSELLESELFGHEAGAFTGALRARPGKFELAAGGTVFLDEISDLALPLQAKLLHVLQDGEFTRLGGLRSQRADVRVIAATNADLALEVGQQRFRLDLYYRLNVICIALPPLRAHREDIPLLLDYFMARYAAECRRMPTTLSEVLLEALVAHDWPGNVRELENLVKRIVVLNDGEVILHELLTAAIAATEPESVVTLRPHDTVVPFRPTPPSLVAIGREAARTAERELLLRTLEETRWNRRRAAERLNISYKGLQNKLKTLLPRE